MGERNKKGILLAAMIWVVLLGILAVAAKFYILPYFQKELIVDTGSESRYRHEIRIAADSFSGYCILRSPIMKKELKTQGIRLTIQDDQANYEARMKALDKGDLEMAVFTIDSFVLNGIRLGKFPASIVMIIDESAGADAIVSHKTAVGSIQDLNHPDAGIVMTPNSPSEFMARTVIAHFNLPHLPEKWQIEADGAEAVFRKFETDNPDLKHAYVLWEPWVSRALNAPGAHLLLDSGRIKGYIVDVLTAQRNFLIDHPDLGHAVVKAYLKAAFAYTQKDDVMANLIREDAGAIGSDPIDEPTALQLVKKIEWKNTLENYAFFGLTPSQPTSEIQHIEEVIANITDVLVKTGTLADNPLKDKVHTLYYDKILKDLKTADFHPGKKVSVIEGLGPGTGDLNKVRTHSPLKALTSEQWESLVPVGSLRIDPISFARGTARINIQSARDLDALARRLKSWPRYYLNIIGHARAQGDPQANFRLAEERATAAANHLLSTGVDPNRIRPTAAAPSGKAGESQSVEFILKQLPY